MFIPHSPDDIESLLQEIGLKKIEDLFAHIPQKVRKNSDIRIESLEDQAHLESLFYSLAEKNKIPPREKIFLGGGYYNHYIPAPIDEIISRTEFYTAYTPYQPEISQGTLQALFEFQTLIADLFGMEVANSSMYDGATALAEAILMAKRIKRKNGENVLIPQNVHPEYIQTVKTYVRNSGINIIEIPYTSDGKVNLDFIEKSKDIFAVVAGYPNFFGIMEDLETIGKLTHDKDALLISVTMEPLSLALFDPPGFYDVDIAVGEGQSFGIPLYFGGPGLGLFTTKMEFVRQMPGRLVGETVDKNGNRGYVLTLATREQHIRREKATSNICSNQGLNALIATIYLSLLGRDGLVELATINYKLSHYLKDRLIEKGVKIPFEGEFFNEFVVEIESSKMEKLKHKGFRPGIRLDKFKTDWKNLHLLTVTELNSKESIEQLIKELVHI